MIKVGCRLTSVARKELNSEYRLRTSRSYPRLEIESLLNFCKELYSCPNGVDDVAPAALMALARICDDNLQVRVFIEYLLNPAIIAPFLSWNSPTPLLIVVVLIVITQISRPRDELWRLICGRGSAGGGCRWTLEARSCASISWVRLESSKETWPYWHEDYQKSLGGRRSHTDYCPRHSTSCEIYSDHDVPKDLAGLK